MQSADVQLSSGRRLSSSSVGWEVNAVGTGRTGLAVGPRTEREMAGRGTEDGGEGKLGCE